MAECRPFAKWCTFWAAFKFQTLKSRFLVSTAVWWLSYNLKTRPMHPGFKLPYHWTTRHLNVCYGWDCNFVFEDWFAIEWEYSSNLSLMSILKLRIIRNCNMHSLLVISYTRNIGPIKRVFISRKKNLLSICDANFCPFKFAV